MSSKADYIQCYLNFRKRTDDQSLIVEFYIRGLDIADYNLQILVINKEG